MIQFMLQAAVNKYHSMKPSERLHHSQSFSYSWWKKKKEACLEFILSIVHTKYRSLPLLLTMYFNLTRVSKEIEERMD